MDPSKTVRQSTVASGIGLLVLLALVIAAAVAVVMNPELLESLVFIIAVVLIGVVAIAVAVLMFAGIIAIPMYMKKGVETQIDMSYSLDDVKEVDGRMVDEKK